ncbi:TRAP transporter small permease [Ferrovibrio terrae]|uniref:TRAP transporter small permease n=1 Tax=Ferrovibrio terrae TaxID=2594003 RepID=UPI0031379355
MSAVADYYFRFLKLVLVVLLSAMVIMVFGNVVLRYGFNSGISVSEELSRWAFVWLTFLGATVALRERQHLGLDSLIMVLPRGGKRLCLIISQTLMLYVTWLLLSGSWTQMQINMDVPAPVSGLSSGVFYAAGVAFSASALPMIAYDLYRALADKLTDEELITITESEEHLPGEPK